MNEEEILVDPIEITRENFIELQKNSKELHELKCPVHNLEERIRKRTFYEKRNDNEVVAYDPINQSIAVIEPKEFIDPHLEWSEEFISDYGRAESNEEVLIEYLTDLLPWPLQKCCRGQIWRIWDDLLGLLGRKDWNKQRTNIFEINGLLEPLGKEMYSYTGRGYFQDDVWELYYLKNIEDKVEKIDYFLEHTVTAYYRGSLEEIAIYDKNEEFVECFVYDRELTFKESPENYVNENVDDIRNSFFVDIETAYMLENSEIEVTKELIEELWEVPKEEREEFLFEGKEKRIKKKPW